MAENLRKTEEKNPKNYGIVKMGLMNYLVL
jgi:hypothetical protein